MSKRIAVIGAGSWGGWSAFKLQEAGYDVTLIDKSTPGNKLSGSGGKTRIIRMAYGGNSIYTDMVEEAFGDWEQYAKRWNEEFYHPKGALWMFRGIDTAYADASIPIMKEKGFSLDQMDVTQLREQYPEISFHDISAAYYEPHVWFLEASKSCGIVVREFEKLGGKFINAQVKSIAVDGEICEVKLDQDTLAFDQIIAACGPWAKELIPELKDLVHVTRHEVYYFEAPSRYKNLPIWLEFREGDQMYYGIPDHFGEGFKFAYDERPWTLDPTHDERGVTPEIFNKMEGVLSNRFPEFAKPKLLKHHTCVYENSIDGDFIIDKKADGKIIYLAGSSGHGFKMGPAIGKMILDEVSVFQPLPPKFSITRFNESSVRRSQYEMN